MLLISLYCTAKGTRSIKACERKITVTLWSSVQRQEREKKKKKKKRNLDYLMKAAWQVVPAFTVGDGVKTKRVKLSLEQLVIQSYLRPKRVHSCFFFPPVLSCFLSFFRCFLISSRQASAALTASGAKAAKICRLYVSHTFRLHRARGCTAHAYTYMTHILRYLTPLSHYQNWNKNWGNRRNVDMHAL